MASSLTVCVSAAGLPSPPPTPSQTLLESPRGLSIYSGFIGWGDTSKSPRALLECEAQLARSVSDSSACGASRMSPSRADAFGSQDASVRTHANVVFSPQGCGMSTSYIDNPVYGPGTPERVSASSDFASVVLITLASPHSSRSRRVRLSVPGETSPCYPGDIAEDEERPSIGVRRVPSGRRVGTASSRRRVSCPASFIRSNGSGEVPATSSQPAQSAAGCGISPKTPSRHVYRSTCPVPRSILRGSCQLLPDTSCLALTAELARPAATSSPASHAAPSPPTPNTSSSTRSCPPSYPIVPAAAGETDNVFLIPPSMAGPLSPEDAALFDADMQDLEACGLVDWQNADDLNAAALERIARGTDWDRLAAGLNASPVGWADEEAADRLLLSPQWRAAMAPKPAVDAVTAMLSAAFGMSHEDRLLFGADMADLEALGLVHWEVADLEQRVTSTRLQRLGERMQQMLEELQADRRRREGPASSWCGVECGAPGTLTGAEAIHLFVAAY
eukprot:XP_001698600.1 predicted protein [Chlamydomonas reinhardtii]